MSIDNFTDHPGKPIDSPRTLEACLRCGVDTAELYPQPVDAFKASAQEVFALTKIKYDHFEEKRQGARAACAARARAKSPALVRLALTCLAPLLHAQRVRALGHRCHRDGKGGACQGPRWVRARPTVAWLWSLFGHITQLHGLQQGGYDVGDGTCGAVLNTLRPPERGESYAGGNLARPPPGSLVCCRNASAWSASVNASRRRSSKPWSLSSR